MSPTRCIQLLFVACWCIQVAEGCIHDLLDHRFVTGTQTYDDSHPFLLREQKRRLHDEEAPEASRDHLANRKLASTPFQPIRMTPHYDNSSLNNLPEAMRAVVFDVVVEAIVRIRRALQVVPVSGNLFAERFCTASFSTTPPVCYSVAENEQCLEMPIPGDHFSSTRYCASCSKRGCSNCTFSPAGTGVPNTDFLIYVRAESTAICQSGSTLAYASTCQQDQYDRPTFGMVNFCPNKLSTAAADFERQVATALHEFSHALGFSSRFFPLMRNEDGTPRTPRDKNGQPTTYTSGTCPNGKKIDYYVEPSNTTVAYSTERGHIVAKLVTPRVRAFVQDHFNCSTLEGAEIESQDGGCLGSHWEERLFEPEYMTPVDSYRNVFSALTLAFFADSGWYHVNGSTSEIMHFGRKKGCSFATDKCVDPATQTPIAADTFCTASDTQGCSADARSRSVCSLSSKGQTIPAEYQYFLDSPSKGGANTFADFCPINVGYATGDCSITTNLLELGKTSINAFGETYCPTCKCTPTSLRSADSTEWGISPPRQTGCYAMRCIAKIDASTNISVTVVQLTIPRSKTKDVVSVNCTRKGDKLSVSGFSGEVTCPDPFVVCEYDDPSRVLLAEIATSDGNSGQVSADAPMGSQSHSESNPPRSASASKGSQSSSDTSTPVGTKAPTSSRNGSDSKPSVGNGASSNGYGSISGDASRGWKNGVGDSSNSSSDSGTTSGTGTKNSGGSVTSDRIVNDVSTPRWASCWSLLGGMCFAFVITL
ncbi:hypothetical protein PHYPSEUDO_002083 [Phytophthora pseudosyringae]|uniref:Leishmanolysin M8 metalloprotease n=1 Tax=Phytophthora pseudosyringae TaxID=221518 RepID=A0A8T1VUN0_9STRA|nr:hypothetical protein PHYPSEUDO_002083 [Phytophthora pseudosyringae]